MRIFNIGAFFETSTAYDGIDLMLNCQDEEERDVLTRNWRDHKLEELNFVGTVVRFALSEVHQIALISHAHRFNQGALLATCLSSTSSWPDVLNNGQNKPWTVRTLWFSGLVFALFAVMIAGIQSMRLHRLSAHRDGLRKIRAGLARRRTTSGYHPHWFQVYAWQASQVFLVLSVALMITGIAVLVWVSTEYGPNKPEGDGWWDENAKASDLLQHTKTEPNANFFKDGRNVYVCSCFCVGYSSYCSISIDRNRRLLTSLQHLFTYNFTTTNRQSPNF